MSGESNHHMLWPRRQYTQKHEKALRSRLVVPTDYPTHCELHANIDPPVHPDIGITLCVIDYLDERQATKADAPLYAIDRLVKLKNTEALDLADHFTRQLGFLGVNHG